MKLSPIFRLSRLWNNRWYLQLFGGSVSLPLWLVVSTKPRPAIPGKRALLFEAGFLLGCLRISFWWPDFETRTWHRWRVRGGLIPKIDPPEGGFMFEIVGDKTSAELMTYPKYMEAFGGVA